MIGPTSNEDISANICTWMCILIITIIYLVFAGPVLWENLSPLLPICNGILLLSTMVFLVLTTITEPGIIPRKNILELINYNSEEER